MLLKYCAGPALKCLGWPCPNFDVFVHFLKNIFAVGADFFLRGTRRRRHVLWNKDTANLTSRFSEFAIFDTILGHARLPSGGGGEPNKVLERESQP